MYTLRVYYTYGGRRHELAVTSGVDPVHRVGGVHRHDGLGFLVGVPVSIRLIHELTKDEVNKALREVQDAVSPGSPLRLVHNLSLEEVNKALRDIQDLRPGRPIRLLHSLSREEVNKALRDIQDAL